MVKEIIKGITEKYKEDGYYSAYRYDEDENEFSMEQEIRKELSEKELHI